MYKQLLERLDDMHISLPHPNPTAPAAATGQVESLRLSILVQQYSETDLAICGTLRCHIVTVIVICSFATSIMYSPMKWFCWLVESFWVIIHVISICASSVHLCHRLYCEKWQPSFLMFQRNLSKWAVANHSCLVIQVEVPLLRRM